MIEDITSTLVKKEKLLNLWSKMTNDELFIRADIAGVIIVAIAKTTGTAKPVGNVKSNRAPV